MISITLENFLRYLYPRLPTQEELAKLVKILEKREPNIGAYGAFLWLNFRRKLLHPEHWDFISEELDNWIVNYIDRQENIIDSTFVYRVNFDS